MTEPQPDNTDHSATDVPYHEITVPSPREELKPEKGGTVETYEGVDLNAYQRRAVLLDRVVDAGSPYALDATQEELADEFGVSQSTISDDFQILKEWMGDDLTREHAGVMDTLFRGAIRNLVEDGEWRDAVKVGTEWYDWLADMGALNRAPDRVDLDVSKDGLESEAYEIVTDEDGDS